MTAIVVIVSMHTVLSRLCAYLILDSIIIIVIINMTHIEAITILLLLIYYFLFMIMIMIILNINVILIVVVDMTVGYLRGPVVSVISPPELWLRVCVCFC